MSEVVNVRVMDRDYSVGCEPEERDDLIAADGDELVSGRNRRYFCLTDAGTARLAAEADALERAARAARSRLRTSPSARAAWA